MPSAFGDPDIIFHLRIVDGYIPLRNTGFLDFIDDAIFQRHRPGAALVNAGVLESSVVEDGDRSEHGGHLAPGISGDLDQACGTKLVWATTLKSGRHGCNTGANQQPGNAGTKYAATI